MKIGQIYRASNIPEKQNPSLLEVDGYPNFYYHTFLAENAKIQFQRGIYSIGKVTLQNGETRIPASTEEEEKVTLVIPTLYENISTQEEADEIRDRNGYESASLEEDGSLTIVMSRSQYEELLSSFRESVDRGIEEIVSEDYGSSIEKIEYNDDYSVFTVTVTGEEIGPVERQTAEELVMYGTLYHIYTAGDADHIRVDYVSRESGEVIESADSGSLYNTN